MFDKKLLESGLQVLIVAYGPLVGERENSVDKYGHNYIYSLSYLPHSKETSSLWLQL